MGKESKVRRLERKIKELEALHEVSKAIISELELEKTLKLIVKSANEVLEADCSVVYPYDQAKGEFLLDLVAAEGIERATFHKRKPRVGGTADAVMREGWIMIKDASTVERYPFLSKLPSSFIEREKVRSFVGISLKFGSEIVGILYVNFRTPHQFDEDELRIIEIFANQAAIAIRNARLHGETRRRLEHLEGLQKITRELDPVLGLDEIFHLIVKRSVEITKAESGSLMLYDEKTNTLEAKVWLGRGRVPVEKMRPFDASKGITGWVVQNEKSYLCSDTSEDPYFIPALDRSIMSLLSVPMLYQDTVLGVINVDSTEVDAFDEDDLHLLEAFAGQAVFAIQSAKQYEASERSKAELIALEKLDAAISSTLDLGEVLDLILEYALKRTKASTGNIRFLDETTNELVVRASRGIIETPSRARTKVGEGIAGRVAEKKVPLLVLDAGEYEDFEPFIKATRSMAAVPILQEGRLIGVISIGSPEYSAFGKEDVRFLKALASQAVIAIQNARMYEALLKIQERRIGEEKLAMISNLGSVFAHRMDNIAGTIPVAVQEIRKKIGGIEDEALVRYLRRIEDDARRLMMMAKQLRMPLRAGEPELVNVNSLLSAALGQVAIPENVKVHQRYTADLPLIEAVKPQLLEVFVNIITNALEAMAPGGGELGIYSRLSEDAKWMEAEITDTGCGMSEEVQKRLFKLFFTTKAERMGFGLWWCKTFIQWLGGDILVESRKGEGSSFTVRLPLMD